MHNVAKLISIYLKPLCKNEYYINDTEKFVSMLVSILPLQDDEEDISYDIESIAYKYSNRRNIQIHY